MIDPILSLAHSVYSNKGVYALLLGSGVSRSAGIPTGWEIVLDLVRRLAFLKGENNPTNLDEWYQKEYGEAPDYSQLLESLCKSPIERQQLLSQYFEPSEQEREAGIKSPTTAHHAIASLCARGYIKVLITTNFDRLMEKALEEKGITPVVLSTTDAVRGAKPLVHQECVIIKVHGDYLDPRTKNSPKELASYEPELDSLLDRVADEYGLIVSGWSGEWDDALRAVFDRAPNRRFSMFWTSRTPPVRKAQGLNERRNAILISIENSDSFFESLANKVLGLEAFSQPHPLSIATASATAKRFLGQPKYHIELHDLVRNETETAFNRLQTEFAEKTYESDLSKAISRFSSITEVLRAICMPVAYFSDQHNDLLCSILIRLTNDPQDGLSGTHLDFTLRATASVILFYAVGVSACASNKPLLPISMAKASVIREGREDKPYLISLHWPTLNRIFEKAMPGKNLRFPASEWLHKECWSTMSSFIPDPSLFDKHFRQFEEIISIVFLAIDDRTNRISKPWVPLGRFAYQQSEGKKKLLQNLTEDETLMDAMISERVYSSKQEIYVARDKIQQIISEQVF